MNRNFLLSLPLIAPLLSLAAPATATLLLTQTQLNSKLLSNSTVLIAHRGWDQRNQGAGAGKVDNMSTNRDRHPDRDRDRHQERYQDRDWDRYQDLEHYWEHYWEQDFNRDRS